MLRQLADLQYAGTTYLVEHPWLLTAAVVLACVVCGLKAWMDRR